MLISGAGLAAALPGVAAAHTDLPVIGVPLRSSMSVLDGLDALLSIVQMPPGVPVACVGVDNAKNAAVLAARILGGMSDLVELAEGLVEIDSINPDLIPGAAGEAELAGYVAEWAERRRARRGGRGSGARPSERDRDRARVAAAGGPCS